MTPFPRKPGWVGLLHARRLGPAGPYNALINRLLADGQTVRNLARDGGQGGPVDLDPDPAWSDPIKAFYVAMRLDNVSHIDASDLCQRI